MKRGSSLRFIEWPMPQILASVFGVFISPMAFSWRSQRIFSAAYCTALMMFTYPVQRHRLPAIASRICCSLGFLFEARSALVVMSMPGVQKPHCSPCFSTKPSCTACSFPPCSRPSTVVTLQPSACTASTVHDFTGWPSRWTVHAPQWLVSQPTCVPVILKFSRMRCTSSRRDSTSASRTAPLMVTLILCMAMSIRSRALYRFFQRPRGQHARHLLLVLDRALAVGRGRAFRRRHLRRLHERLVVGLLADEILGRIGGLDRRQAGVGQGDAGALDRAVLAERHLHRRGRDREVPGLAFQLRIGAAALRRRRRNADLGEDLVARERGVVQALVELVRRDGALLAAPDDVSRAERDHDRRLVVARLAVGDVAAGRAAVAHQW